MFDWSKFVDTLHSERLHTCAAMECADIDWRAVGTQRLNGRYTICSMYGPHATGHTQTHRLREVYETDAKWRDGTAHNNSNSTVNFLKTFEGEIE